MVLFTPTANGVRDQKHVLSSLSALPDSRVVNICKINRKGNSGKTIRAEKPDRKTIGSPCETCLRTGRVYAYNTIRMQFLLPIPRNRDSVNVSGQKIRRVVGAAYCSSTSCRRRW